MTDDRRWPTVAQPGDSGAFDVDCALECSVVAGREKIPGVDLTWENPN